MPIPALAAHPRHGNDHLAPPLQVWLFEQKDLRMEGQIVGFDEYMNLVLDSAEEVSPKRKTRRPLGRILLKGDNITLLAPAASR